MITEARQFGNAGEYAAVRYLLQKGYLLIDRNLQASHHEVDIVMRDGACLVFVEVKTRRSDQFVDPVRAVNDEKLWNLMEAYKLYLRTHPDGYNLDFRIDVVCVVGRSLARIEHFVDPFRRRLQNGTPWRTHYRKLRRGHVGYYRVG